MVAKTRELKKRHRVPLVMSDDYRRKVYRRKRRVREAEAEEEELSSGDVSGSEGKEEGGKQEGDDQDLKMELWDIVKTFISETTGQDPFVKQEFSFHDLMKYLKEKQGREARGGGQEYMRQLFEKFDDLFLLNGDTICLENFPWKEAEAFELFNSHLWTIVEKFICETTSKKPYYMQHFCLEDLQTWFAKDLADEVI